MFSNKQFIVSSTVMISLLSFNNIAFSQYSTINPATPINSTVAKVQNETETFLYNLKPKFKTMKMLGFDSFRLKISPINKSEDISVSFLTNNGASNTCNMHVFVQPDGKIFPSTNDSSSINFTDKDISILNNFKITSLLLGCGLDNQSSPFGSSDEEKNFKRINEFYKNGQVFTKDVVIDNKTYKANYPSLYLLYRNNYADLLAMTMSMKNAENNNIKSAFNKYFTTLKLASLNARQKYGISSWETFNSYDIALSHKLFNNVENLSEKDLENKVKKIAHESIMGTYLLGQREQTESIMDVETLKQTAIIYTIQSLDKNFDIRTTETIFNKFQSPANNMAMRLSKDTIQYLKNNNPVVTGYNNKFSSGNSQNVKAIIAHIDKLIMEQNLDQIAKIEYENMRKHYPVDTNIPLSAVNKIGFNASAETIQQTKNNILKEYDRY
jgi:hypothetical protein